MKSEAIRNLIMSKKLQNRLSKYISLILRHKPQEANIILDKEGWTSVDKLVANTASQGMTMDILAEIVRTDTKGRYSYSEDGLMIRANQGHSVQVDLGMEVQTPPDVLFHGTADRFLDVIQSKGLSRMARHHVHMSTELGTARQVGGRHGKVIILEIDAKSMHQEGHEFYRSENGVWLTDSVPTGYLSTLK